MITRAVLAVGLVWLCLPHQPDLGLGPAASVVAEPQRENVLRRLHGIKAELMQGDAWRPVTRKADASVPGTAHQNMVSSVSGENRVWR